MLFLCIPREDELSIYSVFPTICKDWFYLLGFTICPLLRNAVQNYRALWTGLGAQLARDVPFSAICWSTLEPVRFCSCKLFNIYGNPLHSTWFDYIVWILKLSVQVRRRLLGLVGDEASVLSVLGANFSAGFVAGSLAAAATCPLDVAKTRRQIEVFFLKPSADFASQKIEPFPA